MDRLKFIRMLSSSLLCSNILLLFVLCSLNYGGAMLNDSSSTDQWSLDNETNLDDSPDSQNRTNNLAPRLISYPLFTTLETTQLARENLTQCRLRATEKFMHSRIKNLLLLGANLIEYRLNLKYENYSGNPLQDGLLNSHKANIWARVATHHGKTLLTLAFNYGILSLMTLKLGTEVVPVDLEDYPYGCFKDGNEQTRVDLILELLMRDFSEESDQSLTTSEAVCHEMIENRKGFAKFTVTCCSNERSDGGTLKCTACEPNGWLTFLYFMLATIRIGIVAFGPLLFLSAMSGLTRDEFPYTVKLRDPLIKTVVLCRPDCPPPEDLRPERILNLTNKRGFPKLRESVCNAPLVGKPFQAKISQYDIQVNYRRLLTENKVPIGFWKSIARAVFFCKLRNVEPFLQCCRTNMFRHSICKCLKPVPWINFWRKVGLALLVLALPTPYYLRLFVLYEYEYEEVMSRKEAARRLNLHESFEYSLVHYLLPDHPVFISIYVIYFLTALILAYMARRSDEGRFRRIIVGSFTDLKNLSWIGVLRLLVSNTIWPFRRYGIVGIPVALVYWPIAMPITLAVCLFYWLPTVYVTFRMFFYSRRAFLERIKMFGGRRSYRVRKHMDDTMSYFDVENRLGNGDEEEMEKNLSEETTEINHARTLVTQKSRVSDTYELDEIDHLNPNRLSKYRKPSVASVYTQTRAFKLRRHILHLLAASLSVLSLYAILVILSECVGCLIEIMVFTTMGIIVNANQLLKYIALVVLVVVYSYDSFNNVEKRYLKLNKALFSEVKGRIKDLDKVTSLPSYLQENYGFKSQELNEQAEYEIPDDITVKPSRHWMINDLVLFIDNEDMPRIPKKLFEDVCQIRVAGVPGPVYMGLLYALKQFLKIIVFVLFIFVVILSFGSIYQVSSTNQMLAALAGGSLPMIMRTFMEPEKPEIEMGTVSFKSKLDEIIKNFAQLWPIYDFPFEEYIPVEENDENNKDKDKDNGNGNDNEEGKNRVRNGTPLPGSNSKINIFSNDKKDDFRTQRTMDSDEGDGYDACDNYTSTQVTDVTTKSSKPKENQPKVCFREASLEEGPVTKVDLLINLPVQYDEVWLDEWSDIGDMSGTSGPTIQMKKQRVDSLDSVFVGRA